MKQQLEAVQAEAFYYRAVAREAIEYLKELQGVERLRRSLRTAAD